MFGYFKPLMCDVRGGGIFKGHERGLLPGEKKRCLTNDCWLFWTPNGVH